MKLTDNEKRDIVRLIEEGKDIPEKYRFLLFKNSQQVELNWNGKSDNITNVELPFQIIEHVDEPRTEKVKIAQGSLFGGAKESGWTNKLSWGDNKYVLSSLNNGVMREEIENEGGVKLVYIDPPFDVGADFSMEVKVGDNFYEKKPYYSKFLDNINHKKNSINQYNKIQDKKKTHQISILEADPDPKS